MEVLVTGATGFVGRHVADALARRGHRTRCLVRPATDASSLERAGHAVVRGHLLDGPALDAAVRGVDAVAHVAGLIAARSFAEMRRVNVEGAARLAAACARTDPPPRRFLLVSSLAAAGPSRPGRARREEDPPRPVSRYGLSKLLGERAAARALGAATALVVVRPPAVYGPRDRGILPFFQLAARGFEVQVGVRRRDVSVVHGADLAAGVALALEREEAAGRTYHVADPAPRSLHEVVRAISSAVGGGGLRLLVPDAFVRLAGVVAEEAAHLRGQVPAFSRDKADEFLAEGWVCDPSRAMRELGWAPARSLEDGLAETVVWYRTAGWL